MSKCFSSERIAEWKEAFSMFDKNGDGRVTVEELASVMGSIGLDVNQEEAKKIIEDADLDGNGTVEFHEFLVMIQRQAEQGETEQNIWEAFQLLDKDKNGHISGSELRQVMNCLGEKLTEEQSAEMIREADTDGDGKISYREFCALMSK